MISDRDATELADAIAARVAERVEAHRRRQEARRTAETDRRRRRAAGLRARHAAKLNRTEEK